MNNNTNQDFISALQTMTQEELNNFVLKAKQLGIPQSQINQGLQLINSLKRKK